MTEKSAARRERERLATNLDRGWEIKLSATEGDPERWVPIVRHLDILGPIPMVCIAIEVDGEQIRLPAMGRKSRLLSRRPA